MKTILYYDCFAGISGDMNLAAMIDLGVDRDLLRTELAKLSIRDEFELIAERGEKSGISGTKVEVRLKRPGPEPRQKAHPTQKPPHSHPHEHGPSNHYHAESHHHEQDHSHGHRNLGDIEEIIDSSALSDGVKERSKGIFGRIAKAEAEVHNKSIDEVHFHEVGAVDSIVDIVGAAICYEILGVDEIIARPPELGSGFVDCAHGTLPVPAPATARILQGCPVNIGGVEGEATTPTGAAILAACASQFTWKPGFTIRKLGHGLGRRDFHIPNLLRVCLGEPFDGPLSDGPEGEKEGRPAAECEDLEREVELGSVIECNIDDMNPEHYDDVMDRLFESGARDVYLSPIIMKKSRPAVTLKLICSTEREEDCIEAVLKYTTSFGLRAYQVQKHLLKRDLVSVKTEYGKVGIKRALSRGKVLKYKPEYDDCKCLAEDKDVSVQKVSAAAVRAVEEEAWTEKL